MAYIMIEVHKGIARVIEHSPYLDIHIRDIDSGDNPFSESDMKQIAFKKTPSKLLKEKHVKTRLIK